MADKSKISWTDASWNFVTGCSRVSPGCESCYAEALSLRMGWSKKPWTAQNAAENVILHPDRLDLPLRWKRPRRIFVNSMSDLFHEQVPDDFIDKAFDVMWQTPWHIFQILTKRPQRMRSYIRRRAAWRFAQRRQMPFSSGSEATSYYSTFCRNIWLGVSVEDQRRVNERLPVLNDTASFVRFLSCEPLIGEISLSRWLSSISWVIVGGESGAGFRPMDLEWARKVKDEAAQCDVPFFFKQVSAHRPAQGEDALGEVYHAFPDDAHYAPFFRLPTMEERIEMAREGTEIRRQAPLVGM